MRQSSETVRDMLAVLVRDDEPNGVTLDSEERERLAVMLARVLLRRAYHPTGLQSAYAAEVFNLPQEVWEHVEPGTVSRLIGFRLAREQRQAREEREPAPVRRSFVRLAGRYVRAVV